LSILDDNMDHQNTVPTQPRWDSHAAPTANGNLPRVEPTRISTPPAPAYNASPPVPVPSAAISRESAARERSRRRHGRSRRGSGIEWAWVVIALALLGVVIILSMSVTLLIRTSQGVEAMPTAAAALPTPVDARGDFTSLNGDLPMGAQVTLDDGRSIVLQPWNGSSRFTVLVMGLDRRPGESGLAYRTDTMMLVSLNPTTNDLGILSIPRDLYFDVPGYSMPQKVNTAMVLGELYEVNYGPTLAMQTVQYNLGMHIHNYVVVDFQAVTQIIDMVGGLDIDVPYDIADYEYPDMNYGYDPLILHAGLQHLNGEIALKFARTRHGDNDFERARRQQMVIYALRDRILDGNLLPQLILQSPSLLSSLEDNVHTDIQLDQMIQLALYLKGISQENIRTGVIDNNYIVPWTTSDGQSVLVPRRSQLSELLTDVFGANYSE
jgi:LCP family protein required for cell wall assembly